MLRAMRALKVVGSPMASSKALVCSDCVPPSTAASASMVVRTMLLYGCCSLSDQPLVWQCVLSSRLSSLRGANCSFISSAHSRRAARSFATSMKKFMPMPKKNEKRGATSSTVNPARTPVLAYSRPSAMVKASSSALWAPASCMW